MVEFLAHELNRSTQHALRTLADGRASNQNLSPSAIQTLELQLKTLQKRLSTLDPATTSGRNRSETFDIVELAQQVLDGHAAEFERHGIEAPRVVLLPKSQSLRVKMVKGMVIQVLENLLANAAYWLKAEKRSQRDFGPKLVIEVDVAARELRVTDNGPGVPESLAEDIFKPFFTTKPPGEGKGLGLYIARELAHYHEVELRLSPERRIHEDSFNTFALTLPK
jgi:signal transduction histidine kinase